MSSDPRLSISPATPISQGSLVHLPVLRMRHCSRATASKFLGVSTRVTPESVLKLRSKLSARQLPHLWKWLMYSAQTVLCTLWTQYWFLTHQLQPLLQLPPVGSAELQKMSNCPHSPLLWRRPALLHLCLAMVH